MRFSAALILLLATGCTPLQRLLPAALQSDVRMARSITVVRDEWGVPTIYAPNDAAAAFGIAYAQAEDGYWQVEEEYIHALGRAAHYYGEEHIAADLVIAAFEVERLSREEYEREPAERKAIWSAYAAGLNYYLRAYQRRPRLIARFEPWMPFALHRAASIRASIDGVQLGVIADALLVADSLGATREVTLVGALVDSAVDRAVHDVATSMAWAVAPSRSASGRPLLVLNPHVPVAGIGQQYEQHVHSESGWHVRGFARLGTPVPAFGFSEHTAWAATGNHDDAADIVEVTFDDVADPLKYRYDGGWRAAELWTDTILVNAANGVEPRIHTFMRTHHGSIVARQSQRSFAARIARMQEGGALQQLLAMSRATNLDEFRVSLAQAALPSTSTLYADTAGNIHLVRGNAVPVRDTSIAFDRPVDGADPQTEWRGWVLLQDLPQLFNPDDGRLISGAGQARDDENGATAERANTSAAAVRSLLARDSVWSFDAWSDAAFDTRVITADDAIVPLVREWEEVGGTNPDRAMRLDEALDRLRAWDRFGTVESPEMTLFTLWQERLRTAADSGAYRHFRALEHTLEVLQREWNSTLVPWGEVQRLQRLRSDVFDRFRDDSVSMPIAAGPSWVGMAFDVTSRQPLGARRRYVTHAGWITALELTAPIRARSIVTFGQSADPASPYFFDQAHLYARRELKPAWFTRDDVMSHARQIYRPGVLPEER